MSPHLTDPSLSYLSRDTSTHASLKPIAIHFHMSIKMNTVIRKEALSNLVFVPVISWVNVLICYTYYLLICPTWICCQHIPHFSDVVCSFFSTTFSSQLCPLNDLLKHLPSRNYFPGPLSIWGLLLPSHVCLCHSGVLVSAWLVT